MKRLEDTGELRTFRDSAEATHGRHVTFTAEERGK